jgi:hypothetical protein
MNENIHSARDREWPLLRQHITNVLRPYQECETGQGNDYCLSTSDSGLYRHWIETEKKELIAPQVIKSLQMLLVQYPNWEIVIVFGASGQVIIRDDEIIDGLKRESLPQELRAIEYEGSRPLGTRVGDIMYSGVTASSPPGFSVSIPDDSKLAELMKTLREAGSS